MAAQRIARAQASPVAGSLLSVPDAAALASVGFSPVGEVMGCVVQHTGWSGWGGCGYYYGSYASPQTARVVLSSAGTAGLGPYVRALYEAWDKAISRMLAEASAIGADGVVGVSITERFIDVNTREFLVVGTAVRGASRVRANRPFVTDLSGADTSKLLHAGWVPSGIAFGISIGTRHDDYRTMNRTSIFSGNAEIEAYTDLVHEVRSDARRQLSTRSRTHGGEAVIVSDMTLRIWETECSGGNQRDHSAESRIHGTVATKFARTARPVSTTLTVLSLRDPKETLR